MLRAGYISNFNESVVPPELEVSCAITKNMDKLWKQEIFPLFIISTEQNDKIDICSMPCPMITEGYRQRLLTVS
jgi:hypothetical protein